MLPTRLKETGEYVASMSKELLSPAMASAVIISFVVLGFFYGYLWTRLLLSKAFVDADSALLKQKQQANNTMNKVEIALDSAMEKIKDSIGKLKGN